MGILGKIKNYILRDVDNENETKRTAVIIRVFALIMCIYFLIQAICVGVCGEWFTLLGSLACLCGYVGAFYYSYRNRTRTTVIYIMLSTVCWVVLFIYLLGWDYGVQHFLFALLAFMTVVSYMSTPQKVLVAFALCELRLCLFWYTRSFPAVVELPYGTLLLLQIINTVTIFALITMIVILFSKDSLKMEKKLMEYNEKLEELSSRDPLTKLYNRRAMLEYLNDLTKNQEGDAACFNVAIGDIDFFKHVNDTHGHEAGDAVLVQTSALLSDFMEGKGRVGRWGGEEFLMVFTGINGEEAATELEELRMRIKNQKIPYNVLSLSITMTFGVEEYSSHHPIDQTIQSADRKLYIGKNSGRDRVVF